jgi:DNA polymerase-3 subunit beta
MIHVNVNTADLSKGVNMTMSVSAKKSTLPILSNFLLEAKDKSLIISASDLETTIQEVIPADVYAEGRMTVPAKTFHNVVRNLKSETVTLKEGEQLTLELTSSESQKNFRTVFFGLSAESFPKIASDDDLVFRELPSTALIEAIDKVISSISTRDERFNLSGVYMILEEIDNKFALRLVTSDSRRLNISTISEDIVGFPLDRGIILNKKGAIELRRLAETADKVLVGVGFASILAKTDSTLLDIHLLEGGFPDYRLVVPKTHDKSAVIDRESFLDTLKRVILVSDEQQRIGRFEFSKGNLHISVVNSAIGQSEESLPIVYEGEEVDTGFNLQFYIDALSSLKSTEVTLSFLDAKMAFLLTGQEDPGYFGIIMTSTY